MDDDLRYTLAQVSEKLDNVIDRLYPSQQEEDTMPNNTCSIRRRVRINGVKVWICANSEQQYVDKVLKMAGTVAQSTAKHNFREYSTRWFNEFSAPNVEEVTSLNYICQLENHINPVLGDLAIEDITVVDIQKIFNNMGPKTKQQSKNKVRMVLNQIFKMAVDEGIIHRNPMDSPTLRIKGAASEETKPYTVEQMRYLASHLNDISDETDRAWLALSISLPLRPEEVLGLRWIDIDEDELTIYIRSTVTHPTRNNPVFKPYTKTASSVRQLRISETLLLYLPKRGKPDEFVIGGESPISYTKLRSMRKRIEKAVDFDEPITPRRFRTTVATDISAMTHDLKLVQQMLGHSTPQMTLKHYDKGRLTSVDASAAISECYGLTKPLTKVV